MWNQVFSGDINAPAQDFGGGAAYTTLAQTPVSREKPYLYIDGSGAWNVFVPSPQTNSVGTTWANGHTPGTSIPLSKFFVATPSDSVSRDQQRAVPGPQPAAHARRLQRGLADQGQAG